MQIFLIKLDNNTRFKETKADQKCANECWHDFIHLSYIVRLFDNKQVVLN